VAVGVPLLGEFAIYAPDFLLALDQQPPSDPDDKSYELENRRAPDLIVEHVSNGRGGELRWRKSSYEKWGCRHYVVYDPQHMIGDTALHAFTLVDGQYVPASGSFFPSLGVGVTTWTAPGAGPQDTFVRLCDESGAVLLTGNERADQAEARLKLLEPRLKLLEQEVEALRAMLRKLGVTEP
jgi:hypothetical protein